MEKRTWLKSQREVKIFVFIIAIVLASLFISVIHSRPANAEGFLDKTVRCVVGVLIYAECRQAPAQPSQEAPATGSPQSTRTNSSSGGEPATQVQNSPSVQSGAQPAQIAPIEVKVKESPAAPALPAATHRGVYTANDYANYAFVNAYGYSDVASNTAATPVETTKEGWKFWGIAWYWWVAILGALFMAGAILKNKFFKDSFSIAK